MSDVLAQLARQQEQQEAAMEGMAKLYSNTFRTLVKEGLTREEALDMTKAVMEGMWRAANRGSDND